MEVPPVDCQGRTNHSRKKTVVDDNEGDAQEAQDSETADKYNELASKYNELASKYNALASLNGPVIITGSENDNSSKRCKLFF